MSDATAIEPMRSAAYKPRSPWPPLKTVLWTAVAITLAFLVAGLTALAVSSSGIGMPAAMILGTLGQQLTIIAFAIALAGMRGGRRVEVLSLAPPRGGLKSYAMGFATLIIVVLAMSSAIHAIDPDLIKSDLKQFSDILKSPIWWAMFPIVGLGAPLAEELLFRGFLFSGLAGSRIGVVGASLLTSAAWALVHSYSLIGITQVFIIGIVFSWILVRTGSLRVPIVVHSVYNLGLTALMVTEAGKGVLTP